MTMVAIGNILVRQKIGKKTYSMPKGNNLQSWLKISKTKISR